MSVEAPKILLGAHLKALKLPTVLREHQKLPRLCALEGVDHVRYLARLVEMELIDRERRMVERRIKAARFPAKKSLDTFDFAAIPKLSKMLVLDLARCEWIESRENTIALGPSGTGKTHIAIGLGIAACLKGLSVGFTTSAALVSEMIEARDERRLLRFQKQMASDKLLIIDQLGFVPLSKTGAELLFELISQRYERGSTLITSNLPFDEWTETFGSERLTGALLDRMTHHVSILEMNGDSYRLAQSRARQATPDAFSPRKLGRPRMGAPSGLRPLGAPMRALQLAHFCAATVADFCSALDSRLKWQASTGYGKRALVETAMGRYKGVIGPGLPARSFLAQQTEAAIGVAILNLILASGRPKSVRCQASTGATK